MLLAMGAALLAAMLYLLLATPVYTIESSLYYVPSGAKLVSAQNDRPADRPFLHTQAELLTSTPILAIALGDEGVQNLTMFSDVDNRIEYLKKNIVTSIGKEDETITITLDSEHPDQATHFVSVLVDAYLNYQSAQRKTTATELLEVLLKQRGQVLSDLSAKNREMVEFRRTHGTLSFDRENDSIVMKSLESLSQAVIEARMRSLAAKSAFDEARRILPAEVDLHQQSGAMALVDERAEADVQLALSTWEQKLQELQQQYLPEHPLVQSVRMRVQNLRVAYVASLQRRWDVNRQMEAELQSAFEQQEKAALDQAGRAAEYASLQADVSRLERSTETLDARVNDLNLAEDADAVNIKVLEPAAALAEPTSPRKARTLAVALLGGALIGLAIASAREWTDPRLRSAEQINASLGLPVLASIPAMPTAFNSMMRAQSVVLEPRGDIADAYRMVRTSVYYSRADHQKIRTILITSPTEQDGKSTLASNLAIVMAMTRERVLLIDADMRRPTQHRAFELSDDVGLSSVIEGDDESLWDRAIAPTDIRNLDILSCGPIPIDPAELLNSPKFTELLSRLGQRYDRIVLDAPPVLLAPDARILSASCDATVLAVRAQRISRKLCEMACDDLVSVGGRLAGVVVNDVRPGTEFADRSARSYGRSYRTAPEHRTTETSDANGADGAELAPGINLDAKLARPVDLSSVRSSAAAAPVVVRR